MGTFSITIEVGDLEGRRFESMEALVDTGAGYLVVPRPALVTLDDGSEMVFDLGVVLLRLDGRTYPMLTVFGEDGTRALLGAVALETFGLQVDPVRQRLVPATGLLMPYAP